MTKRFIIAVIASTVVALGAYAAASDDSREGRNHFKARLDGFQENPSISTTGRGKLDLRIDDEAERIEYELSYSNIEGGVATVAHIHFASRHVNGAVVAFLCGGGDKPPCPPVSGEVTGVIDPADIIGPAMQGIEPGSFAEFVRAIRAGFTYANVHSTPRWPGGEIRGQIGDNDDDNDN